MFYWNAYVHMCEINIKVSKLILKCAIYLQEDVVPSMPVENQKLPETRQRVDFAFF